MSLLDSFTCLSGKQYAFFDGPTCHARRVRVLVHVLHVLHQGGSSQVHFVAERTVHGVRTANQRSVLKQRPAGSAKVD